MPKRNVKKKIIIIGAGQIGSRHLQALRAVRHPLDIVVYDPSEKSLAQAKGRYDAFPSNASPHSVHYTQQFPEITDRGIDIAILSTNSDARRKMCENLLKFHRVKYIILEKLLFQKKSDFSIIQKLFHKSKTRAWVNCPMRIMPFYKNIKNELGNKKIIYHVSGKFGLITTAIHYLDHMTYLTGCSNFTIDTSRLEKKPVQSKRKGFLEFQGTLVANFMDGSVGIFTCEKGSANVPVINYIECENFRSYTRETEQKSWVSKKSNGWKWKEVMAPMPHQSQMTTGIINALIKNGSCPLPSYDDSMKIHLQYLLAIQKHMNSHSKKKYTFYPFT